MHECFAVHADFLGFWNFSKNRLAGDESLSGDTSTLCWFWVPEEELPGGMSLTARGRVYATRNFGFLVELPGGDEFPLGNVGYLGSILDVYGF